MNTHLRTLTSNANDKLAIAQLTTAEIERMNCEELVQVIRAAELPTLQSDQVVRQLPLYDKEILKRLAYRARRCCQNRATLPR